MPHRRTDAPTLRPRRHPRAILLCHNRLRDGPWAGTAGPSPRTRAVMQSPATIPALPFPHQAHDPSAGVHVLACQRCLLRGATSPHLCGSFRIFILVPDDGVCCAVPGGTQAISRPASRSPAAATARKSASSCPTGTVGHRHSKIISPPSSARSRWKGCFYLLFLSAELRVLRKLDGVMLTAFRLSAEQLRVLRKLDGVMLTAFFCSPFIFAVRRKPSST